MVPEGWTISTLPDVIGINGIITDGDWIESKDQDPNGDVRLIQLADIGDGRFINKSSRYLTSQKAKDLKCTYLHPGDILIARMPEPLGRACIFPGVEKPSISVVDVCIIHTGKNVDRVWLTATINSQHFRGEIVSRSSGTTRTRISRKNLAQIKILLPRFEEQQKIAAILSSVDDTIQATQGVIDQTRRVKQGLLQQLLTRGIGHTRFKQTEIGEIPDEWENTTIGRVTESHSYGPRFSSKNYSENGNVKTIRGTDLTETGEILYKQVPTAMLDEKIVQQHKLLSSDLVVITTADCGRSAIFVEQKMPYIPSAYAVRYRLKKAISPPYIKLFMQTQSAKTQIDSFIRKGTVANLPGSDVLKIKLPLPPLDEQLKILQIFNSIEFEITQLIEILDSYSKIKNGLMQDLLTGRVRVKLDGEAAI